MLQLQYYLQTHWFAVQTDPNALNTILYLMDLIVNLVSNQPRFAAIYVLKICSILWAGIEYEIGNVLLQLPSTGTYQTATDVEAVLLCIPASSLRNGEVCAMNMPDFDVIEIYEMGGYLRFIIQQQKRNMDTMNAQYPSTASCRSRGKFALSAGVL